MKINGKPFSLRTGLGLAVLLIAVVGLLWGFRAWKTGLENAPVDASYRAFLAYASAQSPAAQLHLQRYYQRYQRDTVAARHFRRMCSSVTALAERDGVQLQSSPWHTLADSCRRPLSDDDIHILP